MLVFVALAADAGDQVTLCCLQWCVHMVQQAEHCSSSVMIPGSTMAQAISCWPVTVGAWVQFQASPIWGCGRQSGTWMGFSDNTSVFPCQYRSTVAPYSFIYHQRCIMFFSQNLSFPCQYHSTIAPYSFIHLPPMLCNVFLPALQFSPVSIIPPLLHTHSFIYHQCCIMFFSQHFSFPLSVSFPHCSILIHSSTTNAV